MTVRVKNNSRLQFYDLALIGGVEFWEFKELPEFLVQNDDEYYQVQSGDRVDTLAFKRYGDERYWWVVAAANGIELVPVQLNVGDKLRLPSARYVQAVMKRNT